MAERETIYETIAPANLPMWMFWGGVAAGLTGSFIVGTALAGETEYTIAVVLLGALSASVSISVGLSRRRYTVVAEGLQPILWSSREEWETWFSSTSKRIFTFASWGSRALPLSIFFGGMTTVAIHQDPFDAAWLNLWAYAALGLLLLQCGHAGFVVYSVNRALVEAVGRKPTFPFFRIVHPAVTALERFWFSGSSAVAGGYLLLVLAIWLGPYGFTADMLWWMTALSLYPTGSFLFAATQTNGLLRTAKEDHVSLINKPLQAFRGSDGNLAKQKPEDLERLKSLMEIQNLIEETREWPVGVLRAFTLALGLLVLATQVTISLSEIIG